MLKTIFFICAIICFFYSLPCAAQDKATIIVYDSSGSMWQKMDGKTRVEIARKVLRDFLQQYNQDLPVGLIAYGHNRKGDCSDIEVLSATGGNRTQLISKIQAIQPKGKTPIADALRLAAKHIPATTESANIVLITDGLETCGMDPCQAAQELSDLGIQLRAHVVGFGMSKKDIQQLSCVPNLTGGRLLTAKNGADLQRVLSEVTQYSTNLGIHLTEAKGTAHRVPTIATLSAESKEGQIIDLGKTQQRSLRAKLKNGEWKFRAKTENGWYGEKTVNIAGQDLIYLPMSAPKADISITPGLGPYQMGVSAVFFYDIKTLPSKSDLILAVLPADSNDVRAADSVYTYLNSRVGQATKRITLPNVPGKYKAVITLIHNYEPIAEIPIVIADEPSVQLTLKQSTVSQSKPLYFIAKGSQFYADKIEIRSQDTVLDSKWYSNTIVKQQTQITAPNAVGEYQLVYVRSHGKQPIDAAMVTFTVVEEKMMQ